MFEVSNSFSMQNQGYCLKLGHDLSLRVIASIVHNPAVILCIRERVAKQASTQVSYRISSTVRTQHIMVVKQENDAERLLPRTSGSFRRVRNEKFKNALLCSAVSVSPSICQHVITDIRWTDLHKILYRGVLAKLFDTFNFLLKLLNNNSGHYMKVNMRLKLVPNVAP